MQKVNFNVLKFTINKKPKKLLIKELMKYNFTVFGR
jgi:hypothetical protein